MGRNHSQGGRELCLYDSDVGSDSSSDLGDDFSIQSEDSRTGMGRGLRITFKSDYLAEAVDDESEDEDTSSEEADWRWEQDSIVILEVSALFLIFLIENILIKNNM